MTIRHTEKPKKPDIMYAIIHNPSGSEILRCPTSTEAEADVRALEHGDRLEREFEENTYRIVYVS